MESRRGKEETGGPLYEREVNGFIDLNIQHNHKIVSVYVQYLRGDTKADDTEWLRKNTLKIDHHFIDGKGTLCARSADQREYMRRHIREELMKAAEQMIDKILDNAFGED